MRHLARDGFCWPNEAQELLLRAALLTGDAALGAWEQWCSQNDIEAIDAGSLRLLPLLYRNLKALGATGTLIDRLHGVYRQSWYRNELLFRRIEMVLRALTDADIPTMVLKGTALSLLAYREHASRPMKDADIAVPWHHAETALGVVRSLGWMPKPETRDFWPIFPVARHFLDVSGHELDLHWHVLNAGRRAHADDDLWSAAVPLRVGAVETCALHPSDQLLHVLVHGIAWNPVPQVRWVADAALVLRESGGGFDWDRLMAQTRERGLGCPVRSGLEYLQSKFAARIPPEVWNNFLAIRPSLAERVEHRYRQRGPQTVLGWGPALWFEYVRLAHSQRRRARVGGFVRALRTSLRVGSWWRVAAILATKELRQLVHRWTWSDVLAGRGARDTSPVRAAAPRKRHGE